MKLGHVVARESHVEPHQVMLLRHSNAKVKKIRDAGASVDDDYTFVQPTDSKYDFLADGKIPILIVAVIVDDRVHAVYRVAGIERIGPTHALVSPAFRRFNANEGYKDLPSKRFRCEEVESSAKGRPIRGWTSPRNAVARYGSRLFDLVEV